MFGIVQRRVGSRSLTKHATAGILTSLVSPRLVAFWIEDLFVFVFAARSVLILASKFNGNWNVLLGHSGRAFEGTT